MIRNVIFDLDGVLFDGRSFHAKCFIDAVNTLLTDTTLTYEYHEEYLDGLSTKEKLKRMNLDENISKRVYDLKQHLTATSIKKHIFPDEKVINICETLITSGVKIFCVSNSIRSTVEVCLSGMGVLQFFTGVISNEDTKEPKPSPEPYHTLYRKYGLKAEESLIIEDSPYGIESATKSGAHVLAVKNCDDVSIHSILETLKRYNTMS